MRKLLKWAAIVLAALLGIVSVGVLGLLAYRAVAQNRNQAAVAISSPRGIDEKMFVRIGGISQWIEIRGQDRTNPVLLIIHGGPGASMIPVTYKLFLPLEHYFTVVNWDQRGAGRTYGRNGKSVAPTMTLDQMTRDGIEVAEFLRGHLHKRKIGIVAASGGSTFGIVIAKKRPDLLYAYVGTGQLISIDLAREHTYNYALSRARQSGNERALKELLAVGPPPWKDKAQADSVASKWLGYYAPESEKRFVSEKNIIPTILDAPGYSLRDFMDLLGGIDFTERTLAPSFDVFDARRYGLDYDVPMFFFQGADDHRTWTAIVRSFLIQITAPHKELRLAPGGGHTAALSMPGQFIAFLVTRVRPFGLAAEMTAEPQKPTYAYAKTEGSR